MQTKVFISEKPERLDVFLADKLDKTRSAIKKIIDDGNVTIKGETVKAGKTLKCGEEVTVIIPELKPLDVKAENIPLDIVYQDDDIAVIDKPQGMTVHAGNGVKGSTLVNALLYHLDSLSGYNDQVFCKVIQDFTSIFCDDYKVFDTNTDVLIREIDSRLY